MVVTQKREREARGFSAARKPQTSEHLWPDSRATRRIVTAGRGVQQEDQAAHFPLRGKVHLVLEREDGVAVLTAIW